MEQMTDGGTSDEPPNPRPVGARGRRAWNAEPPARARRASATRVSAEADLPAAPGVRGGGRARRPRVVHVPPAWIQWGGGGRHPRGPRLFTCSIEVEKPGAFGLQVFVAGVAADEREFRLRLYERYGAGVALGAEIRVGFDAEDGAAPSLVSETLADWLALLAAGPAPRAVARFDLVIERWTS